MTRVRVLLLSLAAGLLGLLTSTGLPAPEAGRTEYVTRAAELRRQEVAQLLALAEWCQQNGLEDRAAQLLDRALTLDPEDPRAAALAAAIPGTSWRPQTCDVELFLVDGSRLLGQVSLHDLVLFSPYGPLVFEPRTVDQVVLKFVGELDLVVGEDMSMVGQVVLGRMVADTKVGKVTVGPEQLARLVVVKSCPVCAGRQRIACPTCKGAGKIENRIVCPTCKGVDSKKVCDTCKGKSVVQCDLCRGVGGWMVRGARARIFRRCDKCNGTGSLTCPDCKGTGGTVCADCQGTGSKTEVLTCPDCKDAKVVVCPACKGAGRKATLEAVWPVAEAGKAETTAAPAMENP